MAKINEKDIVWDEKPQINEDEITWDESPKQPTSSQGAESGFQGNAPLAKPSGLSDFTGKPISTPTSPSASTSSVGAKKITPNQDLALKSLAFNKKEAIKKAQEAPHEEVPLDADQRYEYINLLEQRKNAVNSLYTATERVAQNQYKEVQDLSNKLNDASVKIDELVKSGNRQAAIELQAQVKPLLDEYNSKSYQLKKSGYKLESLKNRLAETDKQMIDISEGQGGLTNQWQALNAGINQLTASILRTPQTVYNTILAGQNKLAEATGLPISAPYQTEGYLESAAKYFDKNADAYHKVIEKKKTQDNYDIISLAKNGDYAKAINLLGENIVESAPVTGGLAMASATGVGAVPLFLGGTSVFAAQNFQENKDKGISVEKNLLNSWTNATLEQIFEETGTLAIVRYGKDLFTKAGKEGVEEAAKTVWDKAYGYALKKLFPIGAAGAEGLSEAETTFTQNYVNTIMGMNDEFNTKQKQIENSNLSESEKEDAQQELYKETLFKGVPDAFITGAGMGAVLGAGTKEGYTAIDDKKREELKQAQKKYDNLATTLSDPTIPKEAKDVIKQQADLEAEKIQKIAEEDDLEHAEKLTPKEYTNVISVQAEIDKLENSLQSVTNPDAKAVIEAKIDDLVAKKHSILGIEKPIKYTSSTNDRYGYVNENGVKRDLTKDEFENYESKVNMEQPMEAAPTEESKGVGESTKESKVQEGIDNINYTLRDKENNVLVRLPLDKVETGLPKNNPFVEQRKSATKLHLTGALQGHDRKNTATLANLDKDGNLFIADGRHRVEAQNEMGAEYGWFEVPKEQAKDIQTKYGVELAKSENTQAFTTDEKDKSEPIELSVEPSKVEPPSDESPVDLEKNKTSEKTENKEAVVPSEEGAMGEDTSKGEQPQAEVVEPTEGSKVEVEPLIKNGMPRKMVFNQGEWKQDVGGDLTSVGKKVQEEANNKFKQLNTKENAVQKSKAESLLPREQGEVREARSEREGVGQIEQGQEPTKASEEEVDKQESSLGGERVQDYKGIFNPKKTGISGLDDLLNDNGYQYFYKGVSGEVVMMSPDEYLKRVREGLRTKEDANIIDDKKEAINEAINKGNKIDMPFISTKDGRFSQEGRNRAVVARERGEKLIPVFIEKDVSFDDKIAKGQEYINSAIKNGATTKEEVISKLEKQGLHRDAIRFIDNNFDNKAVEDLLGSTQSGIKAEPKAESATEKVQKEAKVDLKKIQEVADDMYALRKEPLTAKEKSEVKAKIAEQPLEVRESIAKAKKLMDKLEKQGLIRTIECK